MDIMEGVRWDGMKRSEIGRYEMNIETTKESIVDASIDRQIDTSMDAWMDGWTDWWMDEWTQKRWDHEIAGRDRLTL